MEVNERVDQFCEKRNLGARLSRDLNDHRYRASAFKTQLPLTKTTGSKYHYTGTDLPLDQGDHPWCVGFGVAGVIAAGPVRHKGLTWDKLQQLGRDIYFSALGMDEWPGEEDEGTSLRAGIKAAIQMGYFRNYVWMQTVREGALFVLNHGPILFATLWPDTMMRTNDFGECIASPDSTFVGDHSSGHCYAATGVSMGRKNKNGSRGAFRCPQTWGNAARGPGPWGDKGEGMFWLPFDEAEKLHLAGGQIAYPTEKKLKAA